MKSRIALSLGDYNGIGPELVLKAARSSLLPADCQLVLCTPKSVLVQWCQALSCTNPYLIIADSESIPDSGHHVLLPCAETDSAIKPGKLSSDAGRVAMGCIETAWNLCVKGLVDAMVTAPISKEAVSQAGYPYPGHTEFLEYLSGGKKATMMLVSEHLRVALTTTHIPVSAIASTLSAEKILERLLTIHAALRDDFGITNPNIHVLALNPHAGDGGVMGNEEAKIIEPAITRAQKLGINCSGPWPADGWFGSGRYKESDAVLAMYHDQGLAPFKALSFGEGVNVTLGLNVVRTSPDHGTAYAIAGQNRANPSSFLAAIHTAIQISTNRKA